jgi:hypothetical protein
MRARVEVRRRTVETAPMISLSVRRVALALATAVLAVSIAPAAQAAPGVCNQASPHWLGGGLVALDPPVNSPAARYTVDIGKLPGKGAGLFQAAANSPALTVCDAGGVDNVVVYDATTVTAVDVAVAVVDIVPQ